MKDDTQTTAKSLEWARPWDRLFSDCGPECLCRQPVQITVRDAPGDEDESPA
jgi:hypothetical protein